MKSAATVTREVCVINEAHESKKRFCPSCCEAEEYTQTGMIEAIDAAIEEAQKNSRKPLVRRLQDLRRKI